MDFFSLFFNLFREIKPLLSSATKTEVVEKNIYGEYVRALDVEVDKKVKSFLVRNGYRGLIISEEGIEKHVTEGCIFLDPVDGSLNYSRNLNQYGFLLAYSKTCKVKDVSIGLIWVSEDDFLVVGERKRGVFEIYGESIKKVEEIPRSKDLDKLLEVGDTVGESLSWLRKIASLRHFGSIAYAFKLFMKGSIDGIVDLSFKLKATDVAAFIPILEELKIPYYVKELDGEITLNPRVSLVIANDKRLFNKIYQIAERVLT